ncbi:exodeoxyribonuclease VII small subunit [Oribacterium sinus]|jgi:exonuclease VII small subunit|uniref:exodeoxyribonuclease VII small subunit n=2 Tax=Oribacterium sinus TaxID=237576 RepID=UPI0028D2649A|nr:exodeoxyribonuclease VII small subunit [Oribacterium sinus]
MGTEEKKVEEQKLKKAEKEQKEKKDLNEIFENLDGLLEKMEGEDSLEKSFAIYQEAVSLLKEANESIDQIEKQVKLLDSEQKGGLDA